ncbi:MAG: HmuY family protein [Flavobacteriales bacterium]|nr:hypothetical protein [Flavobacteriales bacterium]MCC6577885.1 HmuY family protein [Flavobacteriales bacterium]NUQ14373.1 HmuY family protein [Flavobacteriales bacterium]
MRTHLLLPVAALLLSGCLKEELPVEARPRGSAEQVQLCMGSGYQDQLWVDLGTRTVVRSNPKTAWDLAFESAPGGWRVWLNGSRLMTAWDIGVVDMSTPTDTTGMALARRIDAPSGNPDSTAIGDWRGTQHVHIIDLGYNAFGTHMGLRKLLMLDVTATTFVFRTAALDGSGVQEHTLAKSGSSAHTMFSFANGPVDVEPPTGTWDMVFTQYTHQFLDPFIPYIVTGVLTPSGVRVARVAGADLNAVTLADTLQHPFSTARDAIGFDWKVYSFDGGYYVVDPSLVYIVQDQQGLFHKLHFLDFYNDQGIVGCPTWEVQEL